MTAGPTPLPPRVSQVMAEPIPYHRAPAFVEVYERVLDRLKTVFQTRNDVQLFAASGTGAMESAVANLVAPGDAALVASCGKFGQRWAELCDAYGARRSTSRPSGARRSTRPRSTQLAAPAWRQKALFTTQSETSTGVVNDVRALAEVARPPRRRDQRSTRSRASARGPDPQTTRGASTWSCRARRRR